TDGGSTWTILESWFDPGDGEWWYEPYDLSIYAEMNVKIAWQYVSDCGENWYIDDIDIAGVIVEGFEPGAPRTIYVDDDAAPGGDGTPEHPFQYIQDGINDAIAGFDSVYVLNGTYYENVLVTKQLNLTGESRENVIIDGSGYTSQFMMTLSEDVSSLMP
ncbi:unnamed protein product, partial [marine sediment metagenome]